MPTDFDVYFFNWTNPHDFTKDEFVKPILQEIGPYRFQKKSEKFQVKFHDNNSTVSYKEKDYFYFDEANSVGRLSDKITTLNYVALVSA